MYTYGRASCDLREGIWDLVTASVLGQTMERNAHKRHSILKEKKIIIFQGILRQLKMLCKRFIVTLFSSVCL